MKYYSTNRQSSNVDFRTAVLKSLASDKGLYMPETITPLSTDFFSRLPHMTLTEIAYAVINHLTQGEIPTSDLQSIVNKAFNFPVITNKVDGLHVAELWHGPTLAFKDFGARFMANLFSYFLKEDNNKLTILTATSGDTGGAVAAGFYNAPNIDVIVLYPKDKVSDFQERQITTWGGNITAIEIDGNFDDCQALVKQAFLDDSINTKLNLSSANSINLARLIPQTIYYFEALKNLIAQEHPIAVSVPSGNFGNLTAGVFAQRLGLPISQFIAATNVNNIVPQYLKTGTFEAKPSIATISNAMDVGNPSNFPRLLALFNGDWAAMAEAISGYELSDKNTLAAIDIVYKRSAYLMDPHTAIGYDALKKFIGRHPNSVGIVLSTAHPIKFESALESISGLSLDVPASVEYFYKKDKKYHKLSTEYAAFKDYLSSRLN